MSCRSRTLTAGASSKTCKSTPHRWRTPQAFDDGEALWDAVCAHELEGVVAKLRRSRYVPGERGWVKTKNRDYWRYEMAREGALKHRRARQFV